MKATEVQGKLTKHRASVFDVISKSETPMSAKDVYDRIRSINLATIYRALGFLERNGYVAGFTIVCASEGITRYYHRLERPHSHFLHCERCHSFFPYTDCTISRSIRKIEKRYDFSVHEHTLYFVGVCGECGITKGSA